MVRIGLHDTAACECGHQTEDDVHFFMSCERYERLRMDITTQIPIEAWNMATIYHGSKRYDSSLNNTISLTVQSFIKASGRF